MNTGYVYKIYDNTNNNVYYGSTKQKISARLAGHRRNYKHFLNGKYPFTTSFKILENGDYAISLIETVEYNDKIELTARERHYIENNECINKNVPNRTIKEYYQDNKDKITEQHKEYNQQNKDKIKEYKKKYQEINKDKLKEQKKEYYQDNKDKKKEYQKEYREANKEQAKKYYEANKEQAKKYYQIYYEANKRKK
jgi:hypothetical protein